MPPINLQTGFQVYIFYLHGNSLCWSQHKANHPVRGPKGKFDVEPALYLAAQVCTTANSGSFHYKSLITIKDSVVNPTCTLCLIFFWEFIFSTHLLAQEFTALQIQNIPMRLSFYTQGSLSLSCSPSSLISFPLLLLSLGTQFSSLSPGNGKKVNVLPTSSWYLCCQGIMQGDHAFLHQPSIPSPTWQPTFLFLPSWEPTPHIHPYSVFWMWEAGISLWKGMAKHS